MQSNGQFNVGFVIILTALLFVFTTASFAQPNNCVNDFANDFDGKRKNFTQKFDQNDDGKVSKEELPGTEEFFNKHDLNQDGYIDNTEKPEKPLCHQQRWGNFIQNFDKDEDGEVSKEEFPGPKTFFDKHDLNQDGFIDDTEIPKSPEFPFASCLKSTLKSKSS